VADTQAKSAAMTKHRLDVANAHVKAVCEDIAARGRASEQRLAEQKRKLNEKLQNQIQKSQEHFEHMQQSVR
jgi:hypothetical protein